VPKVLGILVILIPLELYVGWLAYRGFQSGVVYMGGRMGERFKFLDRKKAQFFTGWA
jgi:hypothetical protein